MAEIGSSEALPANCSVVGQLIPQSKRKFLQRPSTSQIIFSILSLSAFLLGYATCHFRILRLWTYNDHPTLAQKKSAVSPTAPSLFCSSAALLTAYPGSSPPPL